MGTKVYTLPGLSSYSGALNFDEGESGARTPTGPASGDLAASYPDPQVVALHSGAQQLAVGSIPDQKFLYRNGANIIGLTPGLAGDVINSIDNAQVVAIHQGVQQLPFGLINDGQLLARVGNTIAGVAASGGSAGNVYLSPPAVPNALDDEFKTGSSALNGTGGRGFSVVSATTGQTMTRVGDVIQAQPNLGPAEYRSTLTASGMCIQSGANQMVIYKTVSGSLACYVDMRLNNVAGPSTAWAFEGPCLFGVAPVINNTTRRILINCYAAARNLAKMDLNQVYTTNGTVNMPTNASENGPWGGYVSWDDVAKTYRGVVVNPSSERYALDLANNTFPAFTPIAAGVMCFTPNQAQCWVTLRTFRIYPAGVLPGGIA